MPEPVPCMWSYFDLADALDPQRLPRRGPCRALQRLWPPGHAARRAGFRAAAQSRHGWSVERVCAQRRELLGELPAHRGIVNEEVTPT